MLSQDSGGPKRDPWKSTFSKDHPLITCTSLVLLNILTKCVLFQKRHALTYHMTVWSGHHGRISHQFGLAATVKTLMTLSKQSASSLTSEGDTVCAIPV